MKRFTEKITLLQEFFKARSDKTRFLVEGGKEFYTHQDPIDYIYTHGAFAPDGRRIIAYPHPVEGVDALSMSLYEFIDEAVERGSIEWPEL